MNTQQISTVKETCDGHRQADGHSYTRAVVQVQKRRYFKKHSISHEIKTQTSVNELKEIMARNELVTQTDKTFITLRRVRGMHQLKLKWHHTGVLRCLLCFVQTDSLLVGTGALSPQEG
jgi:hypothetical protein